MGSVEAENLPLVAPTAAADIFRCRFSLSQ
jgi:hypothetical protein